MTREVKGQEPEVKTTEQKSGTTEDAGQKENSEDFKFAEVPEGEFNELLRITRMYLKQAEKCEKGKSYLAGCVMVGAALEGLLVSAISMFPEEVKKSSKLPRDKKGQVKHVLDWKFSQMLMIAEDIGWLPRNLPPDDVFEDENANIGDYAERVRIIRNLAHPPRYIKDHAHQRVTKIYLEHLFEVFDVIKDIILNKVHADLRRKMEMNGDLPRRDANTLRPNRGGKP